MHTKTLAAISDEARLRAYMEAYLLRGDAVKVAIYTQALKKMVILDRLRFVPTWSWWGFFFPIFWLFYRRFYLLGFLSLFLLIIPYAPILLFGVPIVAKYLMVRRFIESLDAIFAHERELEEREIKEMLAKMGGANRWAIALAVILCPLTLFFLLLFLFAMKWLFALLFVASLFILLVPFFYFV